MTKKIKLTQGQYALVSDHRYEELNQWKWYAKWNENTKSYYAVRNVGRSPHQHQVHMSRQIMNTPNDLIADHINGDTLDNQDHNLRNVTYSQSAINRGKRKNKTGHKNIRASSHGTFAVTLKAGGKTFFKSVKTLGEAVSLRDKMRKEIQGEYVRRGV